MFQNPLAKIHADPDHSEDESLQLLIGHSGQRRLLLVSFTDRRVEFVLSALGRPPGASVEIMKKPSKAVRKSSDDLGDEYAFDYSNAKPNPYAASLKGKTVAVVLDPDVAAAFADSKAVNAQLRAVVGAVPRRARRRATARKGRGGRTSG